MAHDDDEGTGFEWTPITVGLAVVFASGWAALLWILLRKAAPPSSPVTININGSVTPQQLQGFSGGYSFPQLAMPSMQPAPAPMYQATNDEISDEISHMRLATFTLFTDHPVRVATAASNKRWKAVLRNVGPPGSRVTVADSANNLNFPSACATIPAGTELILLMNPRQGLFAISDAPNTQLSVTAGEDAA